MAEHTEPDQDNRPPEVSSVHIGVFVTEEGLSLGYNYDGMSLEAAIGHMVVVLDRMKEEAASKWATCPGCGEPWEDHFEEDEDD